MALFACIVWRSAVASALVLVLAGLCLGFARTVRASVVIQRTNIVDVTTGEIHADQTVWIQGDRITRIGDDTTVPDGWRIVDGRDRFLIPGLWDMHVHLSVDEPRPRAPERLVAFGVTGVRDMGGYPDGVASIRNAILDGERTGPHITAAGYTLNGATPAGFHRVVSTQDDARGAVRDMQVWGADFIKIHNQLSPDAFDWTLEAADGSGLDVAGHIPRGVGVARASDAGMRSVEHVEALLEAELYRDDEPAGSMSEGIDRLTGEDGTRLWREVAANGTAFTPTLYAYREFVEGQEDEDKRQMGERLYEALAEMVPTAHAAGVVVLAGTDFREGSAGLSLHRELALLVESGLTPLDALRAATIDPASFLGLDTGVVAEGYPADLVLLEANPLVDIHNTTRITCVVVRGKVIAGEALESGRE